MSAGLASIGESEVDVSCGGSERGMGREGMGRDGMRIRCRVLGLGICVFEGVEEEEEREQEWGRHGLGLVW